MQEWGIPKQKILTVITDNGSNMVAAFKNTTAEGLYFFLLVIRYHHVDMEMDRTPCVVHTIQLVVHMLQKETTVKKVLDKARSVVKLFR